LRESSSSTELALKLGEMRTFVKRGISLSRRFWNHPNVQLTFLYQIKNYTDNLKALYNELISKYPNNLRLYEDYSYFLIECAMDYSNGLQIKHQSNLIKEGKSIAVDISFCSLTQTFPAYLKRKILDLKGNLIATDPKLIKTTSISNISQNSQPSSSHSHDKMSQSSVFDEEYNDEIENQLGKASFSEHRLRLACQRTFEGRKAMKSVYLRCGLIVCLVVGILVLLFVGLYFYFHFDSRTHDISKFECLQQLSIKFLTIFDMILIELLNQSNPYFRDTIYPQIMKDDGYVSENGLTVFNFFGDFIENQDYLIEESVRYINEFLDTLIVQSISGLNVIENYGNFTQIIVPFGFCSNNATNVYYNDMIENLGFYQLASYIFGQIRFLINGFPVQEWQHTSELCEIMHSYLPMVQAIYNIFTELADIDSEKSHQSSFSILIIAIVSSATYFTFALPILIYLSVFALKELSDLSNLMQNLDSKTRSKAASFVSLEIENTSNDETNDTFQTSGVLNLFILICLMCFFILSTIAFIFILFYQANQQNILINSFSGWTYSDFRRLTVSLRMVIETEYILSRGDGLDIEFISQALIIDKIKNEIQKLGIAKNILFDSNGYKPIIGFNSDFDKVNVDDRCFVPSEFQDLRDYYQCASLIKNYDLVISLSESLVLYIETETFSQSNWLHLHEVVNKFIRLPQKMSNNILIKMFSDSVENYYSIMITLLTVGILVYFLIFGIIFYLVSSIDYYFQGSLQLLRRVSSQGIVSNSPLFQYLFQTESDSKSNNNSDVFTSVIQNSLDSIICLDLHETIETVNPSVSSLLDYNPEQLLGQHLSSILFSNQSKDIFTHLSMMKNGECSLQFEDHLQVITANEKLIPVSVIVLGMTKENEYKVNSFVIILRDELQLQRQKNQAEEAKTKSEELLYSILPRDIVTKINQGETNIRSYFPSVILPLFLYKIELPFFDHYLFCI
jgi:PAS domain S-box-containing protein